ncbi:hypothetical protein E4H04_02930 [Candidatus Bathyarchaeota archaeon]|nr:MAG: hypothetical protein E4H04_02930 [Candidatus Bathyarchaeota archaeon]
MKIKGFEFSAREFGGGLGDFGMLLSFTVRYTVVSGVKLTRHIWNKLDNSLLLTPFIDRLEGIMPW